MSWKLIYGIIPNLELFNLCNLQVCYLKNFQKNSAFVRFILTPYTLKMLPKQPEPRICIFKIFLAQCSQCRLDTFQMINKTRLKVQSFDFSFFYSLINSVIHIELSHALYEHISGTIVVYKVVPW